MLGSAGIIVMDETTCMVWAAKNLLYFYKHESCGKCTPCREGGDWLYKILTRIENGEGEMRDIDLLTSVGNNIVGKTLCAFGDAAATPALTTVKHFRAEFEAHVRKGGAPCRPTGARRSRWWERTDERPDPVADGHRAPRADLRHLQHAGDVGRLHGVAGAQGLRVDPGSQRPQPGRLRGTAAAVRRRLQADDEGGPAAQGGRRGPLRDRADHLDHHGVRRVLGRAVRHRDHAVRPARSADSAAGDRRQRRGPGHLRHRLDGRLRHRARRLGLEQQVLAARRPALGGADDQLRAVLRHGAGRGDHARRLALAARDRDEPGRLLVGLHPEVVRVPAAGRLPHLHDRGRGRDQPRAVRLPGGGAGAGRRLSHRVQLDELRAVLPRGIREHGDRLGGGHQPVSRRLARSVPARTGCSGSTS